MKQDLGTNDGVEGAYAEAGFVGVREPREASGNGGAVGRKGAEEEDLIEDGDEVKLLGAGHGLTHVRADEVWIPSVKEGLEL